MVNITLICAGGFSTSMLMNKMKEAAAKKGVDVEIRAMAESNFEKFDGPTDVLLLGPQVGHLLDQYQNKSENMKVSVIDMMDYGMMNGEKVLEDALSLLN
ncbi:MAG: cellobiose system component [Enterococcus sp.]|uniref:PTS sugar transporter subunit IIB n=1 Tax=Enterococcus sp. TaxID=35783 RepID=UPI002586BC6A|nr:PTS sugar transporter subunit IIB [Enterococcus sp.]MDK2845086.1 cellobiose system component [Enterococcus sp.]